jgi:iron-sulfur cluster repair protein YtfE (RIC family)
MGAEERRGFRSVSECLAARHDEHDDLLLEVRHLTDAGEFGYARRKLEAFVRAIDRHVRVEEDVLFPEVLRRAPGAGSLVRAMQREHQAIFAAVTDLKSALERDDAEAVRIGLELVGRVLPAHEVRETHLIYPQLDRSLSAEERLALVSRIARAL